MFVKIAATHTNLDKAIFLFMNIIPYFPTQLFFDFKCSFEESRMDQGCMEYTVKFLEKVGFYCMWETVQERF